VLLMVIVVVVGGCARKDSPARVLNLASGIRIHQHEGSRQQDIAAKGMRREGTPQDSAATQPGYGYIDMRAARGGLQDTARHKIQDTSLWTALAHRSSSKWQEMATTADVKLCNNPPVLALS
jgi:hypothetical protein